MIIMMIVKWFQGKDAPKLMSITNNDCRHFTFCILQRSANADLLDINLFENGSWLYVGLIENDDLWDVDLVEHDYLVGATPTTLHYQKYLKSTSDLKQNNNSVPYGLRLHYY